MTPVVTRPQQSREGMEGIDSRDNEVRQINTEWRAKQKEWDEEHNH
jgi:hypothetical protein